MMFWVAVAPVLIALWRIYLPAAPGQIARFERRHQLTPAAEERRTVTDYLTLTRRWRAFGAGACYAAALTTAFSPGQGNLPVLALPAGWLAAAVVAEFRYRGPGGGGPPSRLLRVPAVLAAVVAGVTVLMSVLGREAHRPAAVLAWGLGGLACAAAIRLANGRIAGRAGPVTAVGRAIDLMVVLIYTGPDNQTYWAQRVSG